MPSMRLHSADELFPISIERVNLDLPPVFFFFINQEFVAVKSETLFSIIIFLFPSIKNVRSKGDTCQTICWWKRYSKCLVGRYDLIPKFTSLLWKPNHTLILQVRPCESYKDEHSECKSIRGRFHQYFIHGENLDCAQWQTDFENCMKFRLQKDIPALVTKTW
jgi:hypothetical protein